MTNRSTVIVYCNLLLPHSMTFIRSQGEAMTRFSPHYVAPRRVRQNALPLPSDRVTVLNSSGTSLGQLREAPYKLFGFVPPAFRSLAGLRPALLHAHFGPAGVDALPLAKWLGAPLVVTFHGYDATVFDWVAEKSNRNHRQYARKRSTLNVAAAAFVAVSQFIKGALVQQGFPEEKIKVHYIGVDTDLFVADPTIPRSDMVLFVGRLVEKKGCELLLRAMAEIQIERPAVELVVIGDGPQREALERMAAQSLRRCTFLGAQPPDVVRNWMNRAKVFCVPSVRAESGDAEGFGIVFIEAQAMGLPVVSFASGGIPEAVSHAESGFLAPEKDVRTMTKYLIELLDNPALWLRFSATGRQRTERYFNLRQQTAQLEAIYDDVVLGGQSPRVS